MTVVALGAALFASAWPAGLALCRQPDGCVEVELVSPPGSPAHGAAAGGCISDHCHAGEHPAGSDPALGGDPAPDGCQDFTIAARPASVTAGAPRGGRPPAAHFAGAHTALAAGGLTAPPLPRLPHDDGEPPPGILPALAVVRTAVRLC